MDPSRTADSEMPQQVLVPMNDFGTQWKRVRNTVLASVDRVGESGWFILGNEVTRFEGMLAKEWGLKHAIGCANGLDAIEIALRSLGLTKGEKVLTTPLSAFATTLAIVRAGGSPCFVDTDSSGLIDLNLVENAVRQDPSIRYLVPVHLYGHAIDLSHLQRIRDRYELKIVEDCAQSIGSKWNARVAGSVGQLNATSFYPTKNLGGMGDGGALITSNSDLAEIARNLRDYGQSQKYTHTRLGLNSRLDELQAAILSDAFLPLLGSFTLRRKEIAEHYLREIRNPRLRLCPAPEGSESVWHLFPVLVQGKREDFQHHLKCHGISSAVHYPILIPHQPAMRLFQSAQTGKATGEMPNAAVFAHDEVSIPIHPFLTDSQIDRVVDACNRWE